MAEDDGQRITDPIIGPPGYTGYGGAGSAAGSAEERFQPLGDQTEGSSYAYRKASASAESLSHEAGLFVRDHPGTTLLIAAGAGFLLGLLVGGSKGSKK